MQHDRSAAERAWMTDASGTNPRNPHFRFYFWVPRAEAILIGSRLTARLTKHEPRNVAGLARRYRINLFWSSTSFWTASLSIFILGRAIPGPETFLTQQCWYGRRSEREYLPSRCRDNFYAMQLHHPSQKSSSKNPTNRGSIGSNGAR